jgi:hypothetical protein
MPVRDTSLLVDPLLFGFIDVNVCSLYFCRDDVDRMTFVMSKDTDSGVATEMAEASSLLAKDSRAQNVLQRATPAALVEERLRRLRAVSSFATQPTVCRHQAIAAALEQPVDFAACQSQCDVCSRSVAPLDTASSAPKRGRYESRNAVDERSRDVALERFDGGPSRDRRRHSDSGSDSSDDDHDRPGGRSHERPSVDPAAAIRSILLGSRRTAVKPRAQSHPRPPSIPAPAALPTVFAPASRSPGASAPARPVVASGPRMLTMARRVAPPVVVLSAKKPAAPAADVQPAASTLSSADYTA